MDDGTVELVQITTNGENGEIVKLEYKKVIQPRPLPPAVPTVDPAVRPKATTEPVVKKELSREQQTAKDAEKRYEERKKTREQRKKNEKRRQQNGEEIEGHQFMNLVKDKLAKRNVDMHFMDPARQEFPTPPPSTTPGNTLMRGCFEVSRRPPASTSASAIVPDSTPKSESDDEK